MDLRPPIDAAPIVKAMINLGAGLDIPTGVFLEGRYGQYILNGGLGAITGIVGIGNNFKSTFMHYQFLTAMARMAGSIGQTYDTEVNIQEWHLAKMVQRIFGGSGADNSATEEDVLETGRWVISDKTVYSGNKWWDIMRTWIESKIKNSAKCSVATPFWNRGRTGPLTILQPTFTELDSFTEFETDDVTAMQNKNELGESGANTIHMRQGLAKLRVLMELPRLAGGGYNYSLMTAHIGKESTMQSAGGGREVPIVKLKHLKNGDKIKGTTDKFTFVTHNCWHAFNATPLINDGTKGPEYPRDSDDNLKLDTDLNVVMIRNIRAKSGPTGMTMALIVSQSEGVLPSLTEFHHIKETGRFGLEGNVLNYELALVPGVKLSRTTVRGKIDNDARLRRALNITSEMCQMDYMWHHLEEGLMCAPKELYDDLKAMGYDWDQLLDTRGWWTINDEQHPIPFLSTMDLLRMRKGLYRPYWLAEDKKTRVVGFHGVTAPLKKAA